MCKRAETAKKQLGGYAEICAFSVGILCMKYKAKTRHGVKGQGGLDDYMDYGKYGNADHQFDFIYNSSVCYCRYGTQ